MIEACDFEVVMKTYVSGKRGIFKQCICVCKLQIAPSAPCAFLRINAITRALHTQLLLSPRELSVS